MASSCSIHGIIGVTNGRSFNFAPNKNYWKHDGFLPLQHGDLPVDFFTFGGGSAPLDEGLYSGTARVVSRITVGTNVDNSPPRLELYANEEFVPAPPLPDEPGARMPSPAFLIAGKVCRTNSAAHDGRKAFDIDISQFGAAPQQLIRLHCVYPSGNQRFVKTPLPNAGKHVVVLGYMTGFVGVRCAIEVKDIAFGPSDSPVTPGVQMPSMKMSGYDWRKGKRKRTKEEDGEDRESGSQGGPDVASTSA